MRRHTKNRGDGRITHRIARGHAQLGEYVHDANLAHLAVGAADPNVVGIRVLEMEARRGACEVNATAIAWKSDRANEDSRSATARLEELSLRLGKAFLPAELVLATVEHDSHCLDALYRVHGQYALVEL